MMVLMQMLGRLDGHFAVLIKYRGTVLLVLSPQQATRCMSSSRLIILEEEMALRQGSTQLKQQVNPSGLSLRILGLSLDYTDFAT